LYILITNTEDPLFTELKRRYDILLKNLPDEFDILRKNRAILTAKEEKARDGNIAFNVNKRYEIYICLDGRKINAAMYVLLHELAHITVEEYDHSEAFWSNFKKLRECAADIGVYIPENEMEYCGQIIKESIITDS
jgi:predicted metal-dependent hydrolase